MGRWARERNIVIFLLLITVLLSYFIGHFIQLLLLATVYFLVRQSLMINQLERWLSRGAVGDNPNEKGIWEDIYFHFI